MSQQPFDPPQRTTGQAFREDPWPEPAADEPQLVEVRADDTIEVNDPDRPWEMPIGTGTIEDLHDKLIAGKYTGTLWRNDDAYPTDLNIVVEDGRTFAADQRDRQFADEHGFGEMEDASLVGPNDGNERPADPTPPQMEGESDADYQERLLVDAVKKRGVVDMTHEAPISDAEYQNRMRDLDLAPMSEPGEAMLGMPGFEPALSDERYNGLPANGVDTSIRNSTWLCIGSPLTGIDHSMGHAWDMQHRGGPAADGLKPGNYLGWAQNGTGANPVFRAMFVVAQNGFQAAPAHDQTFAFAHGFPPDLHQRSSGDYELTIADWDPQWRSNWLGDEPAREPELRTDEQIARSGAVPPPPPPPPVSESEFEKRMAALGLSTESLPRFDEPPAPNAWGASVPAAPDLRSSAQWAADTAKRMPSGVVAGGPAMREAPAKRTPVAGGPQPSAAESERYAATFGGRRPESLLRSTSPQVRPSNALPEHGVDTTISARTWMNITGDRGMSGEVGHFEQLSGGESPSKVTIGVPDGNYVGWATNSAGRDSQGWFRAAYVIEDGSIKAAAPAHDQAFAKEHGFPENLHELETKQFEDLQKGWDHAARTPGLAQAAPSAKVVERNPFLPEPRSSSRRQPWPAPWKPLERAQPTGNSQAGLHSAATRLGGPGPSRMADQLKAPAPRRSAMDAVRRYEAQNPEAGADLDGPEQG